MELQRRSIFWGDVRHKRRSSFGGVGLIALVAGLVMTIFASVESVPLAVGDQDGISRETLLRQLQQQRHEQEQEELKNMKILMASSDVGDLARERDGNVGGVGPVETENEEAASNLEMLQEEQVLPKALEAAEMLVEKYKEKMEDDSGVGVTSEGENLHHHHHTHHRHPPPQEMEQVQQENQPPSNTMGNNRRQNGRSLWSDDFQRRTSELCGTSASLECGKRILSLIEGQEMTELSVHMKCDLRDDFLKCIDSQKRECLELSTKSSLLPQLPPKEVIKMERAKLWKVLWTAGGCVLAD